MILEGFKLYRGIVIIIKMYGKYIEKQSTISIGTLGHVSDGKTTLVRQISSKDTKQFKNERKSGKTIRLGYSNAKIYKCSSCPSPGCYSSGKSNVMEMNCDTCDTKMDLVKHVSFVDCPGHNTLMATMLNGTCVMDTAILVESAANEHIPAPQTAEHVIAADIMGLQPLCSCMNKLDLSTKPEVLKKMKALDEFTEGTVFEGIPMIPMAANHGFNIDILLQYIVEHLPEPDKDLDVSSKMTIIRSFNVNSQYIDPDELQGGVIGGTLMKGKLKLDDEVRITPGHWKRNPKANQSEDEPNYVYQPINTKVVKMQAEDLELDEAIPGGLIAVQLTIDPSFAGQDKLVGNTLYKDDGTYDVKVFEKLYLKIKLINALAEVSEDEDYTRIDDGDKIIINCNAKNSPCTVVKKRKKKMEIDLDGGPVCAMIGDTITISKQSDHSGPRLIGLGHIVDGKESKIIGV